MSSSISRPSTRLKLLAGTAAAALLIGCRELRTVDHAPLRISTGNTTNCNEAGNFNEAGLLLSRKNRQWSA